MMRKILTIITLLCLLAGSASAQVGVIKNTTVSATGTTSVVRLDGVESIGVQVVGAGTYTIVPQVSSDGGRNYITAPTFVDRSDGTIDTSITAPGVWNLGNNGFTHFRLNVTVYSGGTPSVTISRGYGDVSSLASAGSGSAVSITQGGNTAAVNASSQLSVTCANCSGSGVSVLEDVASLGGDAGTPAYAIRSDTLASTTSASGDYTPLKSTAAGALYAAPTFADVVASTGTGASGAQTQRVVTATDSTIGTVTTVSTVTNLSQFGGFAITLGAGAVGTGTLRVTDASDSPTVTALQLIDNLPNTIGSTTAGQSGALSFGATTTAAPTYTTAQSNPLSLQTDGALRTAVTNTVTVGSHAVTNAGTFAVQENGAALTALQVIDNLPNTIGSTTSGQSGVLTFGAVTTAAPTYTTAQSAPLSLDTTGALRVVGSAGTTQYNEDTATADGNAMVFVGAVRRDTTPTSSSGAAGDYSALNVDANGRMYTNTVLYNSAGTELVLTSDVVEDAAETAGVSGPMVLSVRRDTVASSAGSTGDNATFNSGPEGGLYTSPVASAASGAGATPVGVTSAASTNATSVKASAGNLYAISLVNTTATLYYIRFYNLSAAPTCSSATGYVFTVPVPASATGAGVVTEVSVGLSFTTGIAYCITGGPTSTDNTNAAVGIYGFLGYK